MKTPAAGGNRLLGRLPAQNLQRLLPNLKTVSLELGQVLYEAHHPITTVYFPVSCVLSAVALASNGDGIEVGTIGNEGMAGLVVFLGPCVSPNRLLAQIPGDALRIEASTLAAAAKESATLNDLLLRHHQAFLAQITQSIACNGLHVLAQRCCRWLLMTHDRSISDELPLTHEFLSLMLAVRRPGVTEALQTMHDKGYISTSRGVIKIIDRQGLEAAACECYGIVQRQYARLLEE